MNRTGYVYYDKTFCGILVQNDDGFLFSYEDAYFTNPTSKPISLTMPLKNKTYFSGVLFPFFDGLIPEGWLYELALKKWGIDRNDRMGVLLHACVDPIGIVSIKENKDE